MTETTFLAMRGGRPIGLSLDEARDLLSTTAPPPALTPAPAPDAWTLVSRPKLVCPDEVRAPAGTGLIYIPLTADRPVDMTCYVEATVRNAPGGNINVGGGSEKARYFPQAMPVWRPDDDQLAYLVIRSPFAPYPGNSFDLLVSGRGFSNESHQVIRVVHDDTVVSSVPDPMPFHRAPKTLVLDGTPSATLVPGFEEWSDSGVTAGGRGVWRSRLAHGYEQSPGNQEVGLYMSDEKWPGIAETPISYDADANALRLHSCKLPTPAQIDNRLYDYQAAMINGQMMDEWCAMRGVWTARLTTPDRRWSWPAFWLLGRDPGSRDARWPPENDILEHFNWGDWPRSQKQTSYGQHAGPRGKDRETVTTAHAPLPHAASDGPHDYATVIEDDFIYWFHDGIEVGCQRNMMDDVGDMFPMLNVAVRRGAGDYHEGSGDMLVHSAARYDLGSGYRIE